MASAPKAVAVPSRALTRAPSITLSHDSAPVLLDTSTFSMPKKYHDQCQNMGSNCYATYEHGQKLGPALLGVVYLV